MIVNVDDQDCDNNITGSMKECQPDFYNGMPRPAVPNGVQLRDDADHREPARRVRCRRPDVRGRDGGSRGNACSPSNYCAPTALCTACLNAPGFDCARNGGASGTTLVVPHFDCQVGAMKTGEICDGDLVLPVGAKTDCSNVQLRNDQQNFFPTLSVDHDQTSLSSRPRTTAARSRSRRAAWSAHPATTPRS